MFLMLNGTPQSEAVKMLHHWVDGSVFYLRDGALREILPFALTGGCPLVLHEWYPLAAPEFRFTPSKKLAELRFRNVPENFAFTASSATEPAAIRLNGEPLPRENWSYQPENRALREENRTLRQALSLPAPAGWKYRTALIVRRDPLLWNERFTLNLGSGDGVVSGAAVLGFSSDGTPCLVGVIDRVGNRSSEVETIFSPGLRLSTDFPTTGGNGILNTGDRHPASGKLPVGTLPANLRFTPGEPVETTGFERGIPRGIRIGELETVEEVNAAFSSALYLSGTIRPAADPGNLHFLVVALRNDEPKEESRRP